MTKIPLIGFAAYSGTGKTTLLTRLIPVLKLSGIRVGVIKHAHHTFEIDHEGKDSFELRQAGADQVLVGSSRRWALLADNLTDRDLELPDHLAHIHQDELDLILVEGFKPMAIPKIELHRPSLGHKPFYLHDKTIVAVATDAELEHATDLPVLDLNNPEQIGNFVIQHCNLQVMN
ncbi:MAG: molybdopterin-guanine dinucleotide biosynthesis protein B [Thiotrichales bacterium]|nr:molybdopterin-guanine dinucleotide biosynthesis protein B [Thiotrichales bacterium]